MRVAERPDGGEYIDTDPNLLDVDRLHHWLSTDAYWALGRSREKLDRAIAGALPFGLYDAADELIGFARVVSDFATFAWICDVYLDRAVRGRGLGTWLVRAVCDHLAEFELRRILLATADAHGVYQKIGFVPLINPERWMELRRDA
jgi:GNAT superfamily N-acetyltransferase